MRWTERTFRVVMSRHPATPLLINPQRLTF